MINQKQTVSSASSGNIDEAERMAKIRELLVGPAIADESARVDQSVGRLNELVKEQQDMIVALQSRVQELEARQRVDIDGVRMRLLGMVETLLADEEDVRSRLVQDKILASKLEQHATKKGA